eukprot:UC4_evm1s81
MKDKLKFKTLDGNKNKPPIVFDVGGKEYVGMNIFDILNEKLRFRSGQKFQDMITNWENECSKHNCNYLQIEYPDFTKPGGYQMAINAKPLFIRHALNLCDNRAVLYIDGDMFIRKYPHIFDMDNVDFMARGWNIDPRASYNIGSSIVYDPYKFETSGGIMYYSQTPQSHELLDMWVEESGKERNIGKADDRILSLIFNSKKFLLNMNIIQLPIEYLWLTLDYDDRMLNLEISDGGYDWDIDAMKDSIIVEHPECLTSEDTAAGAGASSDRNPMFHSFLDAEESIDPVSEEFYEYLFFPDKQMVDSFVQIGKNVVFRPNDCSPDCYIELLTNRSKFMDVVLFPTSVEKKHSKKKFTEKKHSKKKFTEKKHSKKKFTEKKFTEKKFTKKKFTEKKFTEKKFTEKNTYKIYILGVDNDLYIKIDEDLKYFKHITTDNYYKDKPNVLIMGYNTYKSIGKLLPNRLNIVISRNHQNELDDLSITNFPSLNDVFQYLEYKDDIGKIFIIGGA